MMPVEGERERRKEVGRDLAGSAPEAPSVEPRRAAAAVKRCPVCNRTYPREERYYCPYHNAVLVEHAPALPGADAHAAAAAHPRRRQHRALWALVLSAAIICGYSLHRHRSWWASLLPTAELGPGADYPREVTTASAFGGELEGRQVHLPPPDYPAAARAQGITGSVTVEVTLDRAGRVAAARALDGPEELRAAAEGAAREARFKARASAGRTGPVRYDFMLCRDGGDCE